jgi:hypothetical protein
MRPIEPLEPVPAARTERLHIPRIDEVTCITPSA